MGIFFLNPLRFENCSSITVSDTFLKVSLARRATDSPDPLVRSLWGAGPVRWALIAFLIVARWPLNGFLETFLVHQGVCNEVDESEVFSPMNVRTSC